MPTALAASARSAGPDGEGQAEGQARKHAANLRNVNEHPIALNAPGPYTAAKYSNRHARGGHAELPTAVLVADVPAPSRQYFHRYSLLTWQRPAAHTYVAHE